MSMPLGIFLRSDGAFRVNPEKPLINAGESSLYVILRKKVSREGDVNKDSITMPVKQFLASQTDGPVSPFGTRRIRSYAGKIRVSSSTRRD